MSWLNQINDKIILTVNGNEYYPLYQNASFITEYNHTEFVFIDVPGSLVIRKKPIGVKYSVEWHFQGEDHLQVVQRFKNDIDISEEPMQIQHPLYGVLLVQVTSLGFDDSALNRTKITGTVIETIGDSFFVLSLKMIDAIPDKYEAVLLESTVHHYRLQPSDVNTMAANNKSAFNKGLKIIQNPVDFEKYYNAYNTAITYINTAIATPDLALKSLINVLTMPEKFAAQVENRIKTLYDTFLSFRDTLYGLINISSKASFASQEAAIIGAMCMAASTPSENDFKTNTSVFSAIDTISNAYSQLISDLDSLQANNGGGPLNYVPDPGIMTNLNQLVNITISNLFNIALNARSERFIITDKETNVINLTHQLYGLDDQDANLNELISNNKLAVWEYLQIDKGRKIIYYH